MKLFHGIILEFFDEIFVVIKKVYTFAFTNERVGLYGILFNGVMAAQQILVLFVQVRVLVEQHKPRHARE